MSKVVVKGLDIPLDQIKPSPYQPRMTFDLEDIKGSIIRDGILVSLTVREREGYYELVDGERRLRLAKELGYTTVPCDIIDIDDDTARRMVWKVNTLRKDYTTVEKAQFFKKMQEEYGMSLRGIAREYDTAANTVKAYLNIFKLPKDYQQRVWDRVIPIGVIQALETLFNGVIYITPENNPEIFSILDRASTEKYFTQKEAQEALRPYLAKFRAEQVDAAKEALAELEPEVEIPKTPEDLRKAADALRREAKRKEAAEKTPEQRAAEKAEKERIEREAAEKRQREAEEKARNSLLTGRNNAQSMIDKAIEEGIDAIEFTERLKEIEAMITEDPKKAFEEAKKLKNNIDTAIRDEKIRKEAAEKAREEERKRLEVERERLEAEAEEKLRADRERLEEERKRLEAERERLEAEAEAELVAEKEKLRRDPRFISEVRREIISPPIPKVEAEKGPPRIIKSIDDPVHTISVGLDRETFTKLSNFMKTRDMMLENAIIYLITIGLESITVDKR